MYPLRVGVEPLAGQVLQLPSLGAAGLPQNPNSTVSRPHWIQDTA